MFDYEKIGLTFSFTTVYFFLSLLVLIGYSIYVYRYTIPVVNISKKILLLSLRVLALLLILFFVFEPILTLSKKNTLEPVNLIFVDNSRSILIEDGTNRKGVIKEFLSNLERHNISENSRLYEFGSKVSRINTDSLDRINFSEGGTNFSNIFSTVEKNEENISSIVIISDGVITEGSNPIYTAEKLNLPVFTIGVGDTSKRNDVEIRNVLYNEFIYAETPTTINTTIVNTGFEGKNISLTLFENDIQLEQKNITLNENGIQNINFNYIPKNGGEKKLTLTTSALEGEFTFANNKKVFYINVLSNKIKVLLLAGSPSPDLSFIKNSLKTDENLTVNSITVAGQNKFLEKNDRNKLIDSADIFFLIGFPSKETPDEIISKIKQGITDRNKPFLFILSDGIDFNRLKIIQSELPFTISKPGNDFFEVQPYITANEQKNLLLQNNAVNPLDALNNLPPVFQLNGEFSPKPESEIISKIKINNVPINKPLILTRKLGSKRSIAVLAKDIWKWKLQTATKELDLFDRLINSSVKWLNSIEDQKQVTIKTSKKIYSLNEPVEFSAQVYDAAFNPISDAEVKVNIQLDNNNFQTLLSPVGSGLYDGTFQTHSTGDYSYNGTALLDGKKLGSDEGKFNIGEVDVEMMNPRMDYELLATLANQTGGKFFDSKNYTQVFDLVAGINKRSSTEKISVSEINLWSNEWLMAIVIFLLGLKWFFRKRSGML